MPRDGSSPLPPGVTPAEPMSIGEVSNPPFAVLPKSSALFKRRSMRFASLAPGHRLEPYLQFLAQLAAAQHEAATGDTTVPALPATERLDAAYAHSMPPLSPGQSELGGDADRALAAFLDALAQRDLADEPRAVLERVRAMGGEERRAMMRAVLADEIPQDAVAEHVLAAAGLQVLFSRMAEQLDAPRLTRVADGACPSCGGGPVASSIVGWPGAHGARFCTCSICATHWNVTRIKCLVCGGEKGISYQSIEGTNGHVSGETCESCKSYVKMLHQHKTAELEPVADDVATLDLDLTLTREGWRRASVDPFLMGY